MKYVKKFKWDGIKCNLGDSHFTVDSSERVLEKIFQTTLRVWYNRRRERFISPPSFWPILRLRLSILERREKRQDCCIKLNCLMTLSNTIARKLSSTNHSEHHGGAICALPRAPDYAVVGRVLEYRGSLPSRNRFALVTQWNTSAASLPVGPPSLTNVW